MKLAATVLVVSCIGSGVCAVDVFNDMKRSEAVGAAFIMSNNEDKNSLISMSIASNGQLSCGPVLSAYGRGVHGNTSTGNTGFDSLFSQGSLQIHNGKGFMTAVNPASNTVTMFSIDPKAPETLTLIGGPVSSGGEFPTSVAINKEGTQACVINSGAISSIQCFTMDPHLGLVPLANTNRPLGLNQVSPAFGPYDVAGQIVFSEDSNQIIASIKATNATDVGYLATYDFASDGSLSNTPTKWYTKAPAGLPFSLTLIPGQNAIFATDPNIGATIFDFGVGASSQVVTDAATLIPIQAQGTVCWSAYSDKTKNFYAVDSGTSVVTEISIDQNLEPTIVKQYKFRPTAAPLDTAVLTIGQNEYLLLNSPGEGAVIVMDLIGPGKATVIQQFNVSDCAASHGVKLSSNTAGMAAYIAK